MAQGNISMPNTYEYRDFDVEFDGTYFYRLTEIDVNGDSLNFSPIVLDLSQNHLIPKTLSVEQNYPNPFLCATTIHVGIPVLQGDRPLSLSIHNCIGRIVRNLSLGGSNPGYYSILWDGRDTDGRIVPAGIYFCRLLCEKEQVAKKMLKIK
jgi:hypothetical protein